MRSNPIDVLSNDSDPDGDALTLTDCSDPAHGSLGLNEFGAIVYTPDADCFGTDSFTYTIEDGHGGSASATVYVTVTPANDDPFARDAAVVTHAGNLVTFEVQPSDVDGDSVTLVSFTQPASGQGTVAYDTETGWFTYTPPSPTFVGTATFTYTISDGGGGTSTGQVTVVVENAAPVARPDFNVIGPSGGSVAWFWNDLDPDGDTLTVTGFTQPGHGTLTFISDPQAYDADHFVFTPDTGFAGVVSFTYTVSDGHGATATATDYFVVIAFPPPPSGPGNHNPFLNADAGFRGTDSFWY